jgi:hypothetical protein
MTDLPSERTAGLGGGAELEDVPTAGVPDVEVIDIGIGDVEVGDVESGGVEVGDVEVVDVEVGDVGVSDVGIMDVGSMDKVVPVSSTVVGSVCSSTGMTSTMTFWSESAGGGTVVSTVSWASERETHAYSRKKKTTERWDSARSMSGIDFAFIVHHHFLD